MVAIKPLDEIRKNYEAAASRVSEPYKSGILRNTNWQAQASSSQAESNYAAKVQAAIAAKRRQLRVAKISQSQWQGAASTDGAAKIGVAMGLAGDKQSSGFAPYHSVIAGLSLPARTADPIQNVQRVTAVVTALVNKKKTL